MQFGRALSELNIEILCANTSQDKGRVERAHHTVQDRLVKELQLDGISTIDGANAFCPALSLITKSALPSLRREIATFIEVDSHRLSIKSCVGGNFGRSQAAACQPRRQRREQAFGRVLAWIKTPSRDLSPEPPDDIFTFHRPGHLNFVATKEIRRSKLWNIATHRFALN